MTVYDIAAQHINHQADLADDWEVSIEEFEDYLSDLEDDISLGAVKLRKTINGHIADFKETLEADIALSNVVVLNKRDERKKLVDRIVFVSEHKDGMEHQEKSCIESEKEMIADDFPIDGWDRKDNRECLDYAIKMQVTLQTELDGLCEQLDIFDKENK